MMNYYREPNPDRIPDVILALDGVAREAGGTMFTIGFLSSVFEANPAKVSNWLSEINTLSESHRKLVLQAVWLSGTPEAQDMLLSVGHDKLIELFKFDLSSRRGFADDRVIKYPADLDFYWGRFFASGRDVPVRRIIAALPWQADKPLTAPVTPEEKAMALRWANGAAAQWALTANASGYERVLEICKAELPQAGEPIRGYLEKVVKAAEMRKAASR
jgi:hypothetical protein